MKLPEALRGRLPELAILVLLLAAASWLRFGDLALCEFKFDEAIAIDLATPIVDGKDWPKVGLVSSVEVKNPPLMMYLLALPMLFSEEPVFVTGFIGLLAVAAVGLTYFVLRRRFGPFVALGAAGLWAVAPWAVLYARKIWAQSLLALFVVLLLHVLLVVLERRKTWHVAWAPILLGALGQLHLSAVAMIPVLAIVLLARARAVRWTAFGVGVLVALGMLYPYIHHQLTHGFEDFKLAAAVAKRTSAQPKQADLRPVSLTVDLLGSRGFSYVTGGADAALTNAAPTSRKLADVATKATTVLFALGFLVAAIRLARAARWKRAFPFAELDEGEARRAVVWLWVAGLWAFFMAASLDIYPHYFIIAYPAPFILALLFLRDVAALFEVRWQPFALGTAAVLVGGCVLAYGLFDAEFRSFIAANRGTPGDYGTAYVDKSQAVRYALDNDLALVGGPPELGLLVKLRRRHRGPAGAPKGMMQVGDRHRGGVPGCPPERKREFGAIVGCLR